MMAGKGYTAKPLNALKRTDKNSKTLTPKIKKPKQKKKKRLIVRNLSFKVEEDDLKKIFSEFGTVKEAIIPKKEDGKKRGFGFVEFEDTKSLIKAMKSMNWKEIKGRKVAVDFAVDKNTYQSKVKSIKQEDKDASLEIDDIKTEAEIKEEPISDEDDDAEKKSEEEEEKKLNDFLKDFYSGSEKLTKSPAKGRDMSSDESSSEEGNETEDSETEDDDDDSPVPKKKIKQESDDDSSVLSKEDSARKKKVSRDVTEGKTVFLRNVSFVTTEDSLREAMNLYGEYVYCLLCMDQYTDHPKGTAFVKFKDKESADKLVKESLGEPGVVVDGRKLTCSFAMSREDVSHVGEDTKKPKDKRNLNLLRVGLIMPNTPESEGVSASDMTKRAQLEMAKKQKLKNVNFFVSDKRLMIHNLPKTYTDEKLRKLLKKAAGPNAVITEARVMKEFRKIDISGTPLSKGYGFASFKNHEDALKVLNELNNNPNIFTPLKRPIVEFSVENKVALLSQERRKEKMKARNKKRTEEKKERQSIENAGVEESSDVPKKKKNRRKKKNNQVKQEIDKQKKDKEITLEDSPKKRKNRRKKKNLVKNEFDNHGEDTKVTSDSISPKSLKKKNKRSRQSTTDSKKLLNGKSQQNMTNLVNKFKDKLKNKIT